MGINVSNLKKFSFKSLNITSLIHINGEYDKKRKKQ
jgi:hypothetical protein